MVAPSGDRRRCANAERASFRSRNPARLPAELAGESRKTWCGGGIILGIYAASRSRAGRRRGARDRRLEPGQGALPEAEVHEARSRTLLPGRRRRRAARGRWPAQRAGALPQRDHRRVLLSEARAGVAAALERGGHAALPLGPHGRGSRAPRRRPPQSRPPWIEVVTLRFPSGRTAEEVVPRDAAALVWLANLACLELHPHPGRTDALAHPAELRAG